MDFMPIARLGILLVRPGALLMMAPGFGGQQVPVPARIGLTVLLALALAPAVTLPEGPNASIVITVFREVAIGLSLGLAARALIAGAELAGHLCSQQIGFSYAATINPEGGARNGVLASLYGMLAVFTWLGIGGHHLLLRALHASYEGLPIGAGHVDASLLESVRQVMGLVFTVGIRLASPLVAVLLLVEIAVGLISRAAPALSFYVIGDPVRLAVGLIVVAATISTVPGVTRTMAEHVVQSAMTMAGAFR
jgi:flagellar biosynthetic protein FliR